MAIKHIQVMDTSFRDGFQSVFGARVLTQDFLPALEAAVKAGIRHFEIAGGARFQSLFFYCNENAFDMMDTTRSVVGPSVELQSLSRGINVVGLESQSKEVIDLHAKLFKKHGMDTIRNFDALNDVTNLEYPAQCIKQHGLKHEIGITLMDLPPGCEGAHDADFYTKILQTILDRGIPFDSICFKDASGTSHPRKVFETIQKARQICPKDTFIRFHTHESAGISVACYIAAIEAGADGIDLAMSPVSGGTSQPDILTMIHALKHTEWDLGLDSEKILQAEEVFKSCMKDYFFPPEALVVSPLIPFSPMPGGALTANTQMMRDNGILDKFPEVMKAMEEVVRKGGFGTSVTPVSQFYFQQAFNNVQFGLWKKIAEGYGKMVLGYFGKTPVQPDLEVVKIASEQLKLVPTQLSPLERDSQNPKKSLSFFTEQLKENQLPVNEENIFIVATCEEKGIQFLKGNAKQQIRKNVPLEEEISQKANQFEVNLDGQTYEVIYHHDKEITIDGKAYPVNIKESTSLADQGSSATNSSVKTSKNTILAPMPGQVMLINKTNGNKVTKGDVLLILEAMKMEIEIKSSIAGTIQQVLVKTGQMVKPDQPLIEILSNTEEIR